MRRTLAACLTIGLLAPHGAVACPHTPGIAAASWYGAAFEGRRMADGHRFRSAGVNAASRTYPFGTVLRLTNIANGRVAFVVIQDRGPYVRGRDLDLSRGAARVLGFEREGLACVRVAVMPARAGRDARLAP